jgi:hypothetical protein
MPMLPDDPNHPGHYGFDEWLSATNCIETHPARGDRREEGKISEISGAVRAGIGFGRVIQRLVIGRYLEFLETSFRDSDSGPVQAARPRWCFDLQDHGSDVVLLGRVLGEAAGAAVQYLDDFGSGPVPIRPYDLQRPFDPEGNALRSRGFRDAIG